MPYSIQLELHKQTFGGAPVTEKVQVSDAWQPEERSAVQGLIETKIEELKDQEREWRKTILWEAPCYIENQTALLRLDELSRFVADMPVAFLKKNRQNFHEFVA